MDSIHFLLSHNDIELNSFAPFCEKKKKLPESIKSNNLIVAFSFTYINIPSKNKMFNFIRVI